ncbi:hypothetical protein XELAEV_18011826mg [Xenopus laevis]|uniref:Uncharacterized protein n=1 Tax=Xenopus laevis TaxID=8355 RepID=A0A974HXU9_XENLA|nr:hypothetical protein XELAEV_18011826mg [Xenopus laevis]
MPGPILILSPDLILCHSQLPASLLSNINRSTNCFLCCLCTCFIAHSNTPVTWKSDWLVPLLTPCTVFLPNSGLPFYRFPSSCCPSI